VTSLYEKPKFAAEQGLVDDGSGEVSFKNNVIRAIGGSQHYALCYKIVKYSLLQSLLINVFVLFS